MLNDWQLSGIFRADSGAPYDVGYSYNTGPTGQALTGSPDYTARIVVNDLGALGSGCSSDQYQQIRNTMVPGVWRLTGDDGGALRPAGRQPRPRIRPLPAAPAARTTASIWRFSARSGSAAAGTSSCARTSTTRSTRSSTTGARRGIQFNSTTDMTVRNSQFRADGTMDPARTQPNQAGFGAATGALALALGAGHHQVQLLRRARTRRRSRRARRRPEAGGACPHPLFLDRTRARRKCWRTRRRAQERFPIRM